MRTFIVYGATAHSDGKYNLSDMPGSGGRIDVLARCATAAFVLSDDIRKDVRLYMILAGHGEEKVIRLDGSELRNLNPDERSTGALLRHALLKNANREWTKTGPGASVRLGGMREVLIETGSAGLVQLRKDGSPLVSLPRDPIMALGDHKGFPLSVERMLEEAGALPIGMGPNQYHSDHCIVHANIHLDNAGSR